MKKNKKIFLIFFGIMIAALAAWYFLKKKKTAVLQSGSGANQPPSHGGNEGSAIHSKGALPAPTVDAFPVVLGSKGKYVKAIQAELNAKHGAKLATDGILGPKTEAAMKKAGLNLPVDLPTFNKFFGK